MKKRALNTDFPDFIAHFGEKTVSFVQNVSFVRGYQKEEARCRDLSDFECCVWTSKSRTNTILLRRTVAHSTQRKREIPRFNPRNANSHWPQGRVKLRPALYFDLQTLQVLCRICKKNCAIFNCWFIFSCKANQAIVWICLQGGLLPLAAAF